MNLKYPQEFQYANAIHVMHRSIKTKHIQYMQTSSAKKEMEYMFYNKIKSVIFKELKETFFQKKAKKL